VWTAIGLVIALGGAPIFVAVTAAIFGPSPTFPVQVALQVLHVVMAGCVVWIVVRGERKPLASIGLRAPDRMTFVLGVLGCACAFYLLPLATDPLSRWIGASTATGVATLATLPVWFRLVLAVSGGAIEELLYRGYAIERLSTMLGRRWAAGLLSMIFFAAAHVPEWGWQFALAADLPFGILMTLLYLWRRDVVACALAHSGGLVIAMLTLPVDPPG
jgi:membrane protease YdiL (CAAX protease family)